MRAYSKVRTLNTNIKCEDLSKNIWQNEDLRKNKRQSEDLNKNIKKTRDHGKNYITFNYISMSTQVTRTG